MRAISAATVCSTGGIDAEGVHFFGDPRIVGPDKEIFETYIRYSPLREFPKPEFAE